MNRNVLIGWQMLSVLVLAILAATGASANSGTVSYQGVLRDAALAPVADGAYAMRFSIFSVDTGGASVWGPETQTVSTRNGLFSVNLGSNVPLGTVFADYAALWLQIEVNLGPGLEVYNPRVPLASVPYAQKALYAQNAVNATNASNATNATSAANAGDSDKLDGEHLSDILAEVDNRIAALANKITPIGTIIGWHKNMTGTPALLGTWVECNGQVISDAASPYNGQATPNLNGQRRFLRGSGTSGTLEDHQLQDHKHTVFDNGTNKPPDSGTDYRVNLGSQFYYNAATHETSNPTSGNHGAETRPINMSVVWVMRIK